MEVGLSAFTMGVNSLEAKLDTSTRPDIPLLLVFVPILLTCLGVLAVKETAVFVDWVGWGCELEAAQVTTGLPATVLLDISEAAREVSNFRGSEISLLEGFRPLENGRIGRLIGVTVTAPPPLEGVFTTAVGLRRISGVVGLTGPM